MSVLVTGCAGFIGSKVTDLLLREGHEVFGVDTLNDAYSVLLKRWRLGHLEQQPSFRFQNLDITDRHAVESLFYGESKRSEPLRSVIHLAARAGVRQSLADPWSYYQTNVEGTLNILEQCRRHKTPKFVLASTSSVYGESERPFREDAPTDRPLSPYAASKKAAEVLCYTYSRLHGLDTTVLRFFTVYGPAGRPDMSIFRFIKWISEGEPVLVNGDGSQKRDFTYVDDIARGALLAMKPLGYEAINLGSDQPISLHEIIERIEGLVGKRAHIVHRPGHPTDVAATWADVTRARALLEWVPSTDISDGLARVVEWYQENRDWAKDCIDESQE